MQRQFGHERLIDIMKRCGYEANAEGVCFGVAHMGLQAVLAGKVDDFNARLERIFAMSDEEIMQIFPYFLHRAGEKVSGEIVDALTPQQWELAAFCEGVELYMNAYRYQELFAERVTGQRAGLSGQLVASTALREEKYIHTQTRAEIFPSDASFASLMEQGLVKKITGRSKVRSLGRMTCAYHRDSLPDFFAEVRKQVTMRGGIRPMAMILSSGNHAITVSYDVEKKKWLIIDANHLPGFYVSEYLMKDKIVAALSSSDNNNTIFGAEFYCLNSHVHASSLACMETLQEMNAKYLRNEHEVIASMRDAQNISCLYVAALHGDVETVKLLADEKVDETGCHGVTALFVAAHDGYTEVARILMQHGADVNFVDPHKRSVLSTAANAGHLDVVKLLLASGKIDLAKNVVVQKNALETICTALGISAQALLASAENSSDDTNISIKPLMLARLLHIKVPADSRPSQQGQFAVKPMDEARQSQEPVPSVAGKNERK